MKNKDFTNIVKEYMMEKLPGYMDNHWCLSRFFEEYDNNKNINIKTIAENIDKSVRFRRENNCEQIRKILKKYDYKDYTILPYWDKIKDIYPNFEYIIKEDTEKLKVSVIIYTSRKTKKDYKTLVKNISTKEFQEYILYQTVQRDMLLDKLSRKYNKKVRTHFIWDFKGISTSYFYFLNRNTGYFDSLLNKQLGPLFPDMMENVVLLNSPLYVRAFWKGVKLTLPEDVCKRVHIIGSSEKSLKEIKDKLDIDF
jgi:hypothetical protein